MIHVEPGPEPPTFDERCHQRGMAWLTEHPDFARPRGYWGEFEQPLRDVFRGLCGYCAMTTMRGQIDHFVPVAALRGQGRLDLIYEWSNFRYGDPLLNQRKGDADVLDPFRVQDDWFEIQLPSLQLLPTEAIPANIRALADATLLGLGLRDDEVVIRYRSQFFEMYRNGKITLEALDEFAPQIARAVRRDIERGIGDWRDPPATPPRPDPP